MSKIKSESIKWSGISVITPTHGRTGLVEQLLASLAQARECYEGEVEILIIDSSPTDQCTKIEQLCARFCAHFHYMQNNVREKRNWGVMHAHHPIILFIDSDCRADVNLLVEHAQAYEQNGFSQIGGVVGLTRFIGAENWVWQVIKRAPTLDSFSYPEHHKVVPWGPTCNMSYRREILVEETGLFDTSFPFALGGDDTDLGLRVTDAGYPLITNANAVVEHEKETWSSVPLISKRIFRWGRMQFYIMQKHPHRVQINPPTVSAVFLLLALLLVPIGLVERSLVLWIIMPLIWLCLEFILEATWLKDKKVRQPTELLYIIGSLIFSVIFQTGTILEGIKNHSLVPIYQGGTFSPPSPQGRKRWLAQIWAMILAFPLTIFGLMILHLIFRSL